MTTEEEEAARVECEESDKRYKEDSTAPPQRTFFEVVQSRRIEDAIRELREGEP